MGNAFSPAVHCGNWRFDEAGQFSQPTKVVHDLVAKPLHGSIHAIIATRSQAGKCDNRDCDFRDYAVERAMDVNLLKQLIEERGETQAGIARLLDITPDKVSKTLAGKRALKLTEANILRRYFGLDEPETKASLLPIVGLVSAGEWREGFEVVMGYMPSPDKSLGPNSFVVIIEGDSMDKVAQAGEGIIVDPSDLDLVSGCFYVVRNGDGQMTFKQYRDNPARLEPCSTNPSHKSIFPGRDEFTVVGRARKRVSDL